VSSIPPDQAFRARRAATLCVEAAPATLTGAAIVAIGAEFAPWPVCLISAVPFAFAIRTVYRTLETDRRWTLTRWLAAEQRWRLRRGTAAELEGGTTAGQHLVVDGDVVERAS
jgi:hypothetical protein